MSTRPQTSTENMPLELLDPQDDQRSLDDLEVVISRGLQTFMDVGKALASIRQRKLYREKGYGTFKEYCRAEWELADRTARQIMQASEIVEEMQAAEPKSGATAPVLPETERQARPLSRIADPKERSEVWRETVEEAQAEEKPVTAAKVQRKVEEKLKAESTSNVANPNGSRSEQTEEISPAKPDWRQSYDKFNLLLKRLHELAAGVDQAGGLNAIIGRWPESDQRAFRRHYRELGERVGEQVNQSELSERR